MASRTLSVRLTDEEAAALDALPGETGSAKIRALISGASAPEKSSGSGATAAEIRAAVVQSVAAMMATFEQSMLEEIERRKQEIIAAIGSSSDTTVSRLNNGMKQLNTLAAKRHEDVKAALGSAQ